MVTGMPEFQVEKEGVCPGCAEGKLKRGPFPSSQSKTSDILQLVHSDISEAGIKRETTTPFTLEQNGGAGRKNHTMMEVVRAMLHDQRLPKFLWVKAANTIVYVQNRCPHQELGSKTPKEMFTGKKPDISHFRIFGSPVYFHVPKEKMNKLCAFGKKGIFVGYGENTKGYRIYVADQREVVISHDVTFDKDMALSKVDNILTLTSSQESDTRE